MTKISITIPIFAPSNIKKNIKKMQIRLLQNFRKAPTQENEEKTIASEIKTKMEK
jgi:hypothetical protein